MRPRIIATALIAAAAAALAGCASARGPSHATSGAVAGSEIAALPGRPACFRAADFDGTWITLSDRELIVPDRVFSRSYLLRLSEPVYNLRLRHRLGFEPFTPANGCICDGLNDYLLAARSGLRGRVPITAVRELSQTEERQLLSEHHIRPTAALPTRNLGRPNNGCPIA